LSDYLQAISKIASQKKYFLFSYRALRLCGNPGKYPAKARRKTLSIVEIASTQNHLLPVALIEVRKKTSARVGKIEQYNKLNFVKIFVTGSPGKASLSVTLIKSIRKLNGLSRNLAKRHFNRAF